MILDKQLTFSDAQAITAAAGSDNTIDLGEARDIGTGKPLYVVVVVDTAFTDASSNSTLTVALEGDSTESFTPDGTQDLFTFSALSAAGTVKYAALDPGAAPLQYRYIRLKYTPNNGDLTTGAVSAYLVEDVQQFVAYANNYTIT
jgi:hypothetical protein